MFSGSELPSGPSPSLIRVHRRPAGNRYRCGEHAFSKKPICGGEMVRLWYTLPAQDCCPKTIRAWIGRNLGPKASISWLRGVRLGRAVCRQVRRYLKPSNFQQRESRAAAGLHAGHQVYVYTYVTLVYRLQLWSSIIRESHPSPAALIYILFPSHGTEQILEDIVVSNANPRLPHNTK